MGLGRIGQAIAHRAEAFEQTVLYTATAEKKHTPNHWSYVDNVQQLTEHSDVLQFEQRGFAAAPWFGHRRNTSRDGSVGARQRRCASEW